MYTLNLQMLYVNYISTWKRRLNILSGLAAQNAESWEWNNWSQRVPK